MSCEDVERLSLFEEEYEVLLPPGAVFLVKEPPYKCGGLGALQVGALWLLRVGD